MRWANVRRPQAYAKRIADGASPAVSREVLGSAERAVEAVLLGLRRIEGVPVSTLGPAGRASAEQQARDGRLDPDALAGGRATLTRTGRLLADQVALALIE